MPYAKRPDLILRRHRREIVGRIAYWTGESASVDGLERAHREPLEVHLLAVLEVGRADEVDPGRVAVG